MLIPLLVWLCWSVSSSSPWSFSWRSRKMATFRCRGVSHFAVPGPSGTKLNAQYATHMLGKPSRRNKSLQGSSETWLASLVISQASTPARAADKGAAEMNRPVRNASSRRRKKKDR